MRIWALRDILMEGALCIQPFWRSERMIRHREGMQGQNSIGELGKRRRLYYCLGLRSKDCVWCVILLGSFRFETRIRLRSGKLVQFGLSYGAQMHLQTKNGK